jgi:hypothetical protein
MAAPKHNQFWKNRSTHGREKLFATPELLWEAAQEYFNWCDAHPWYKVEANKNPKALAKDKLIKVPTAIPYTLSGLCIYLDTCENWWREFRKRDTLSKDFMEVIARIEEIVRNQKFTGAAVGAFNHNIIARDLGMVDKGEMGFRDKDGNPADLPPIVKQVMIINGKEIEF